MKRKITTLLPIIATLALALPNPAFALNPDAGFPPGAGYHLFVVILVIVIIIVIAAILLRKPPEN